MERFCLKTPVIVLPFEISRWNRFLCDLQAPDLGSSCDYTNNKALFLWKSSCPIFRMFSQTAVAWDLAGTKTVHYGMYMSIQICSRNSCVSRQYGGSNALLELANNRILMEYKDPGDGYWICTGHVTFEKNWPLSAVGYYCFRYIDTSLSSRRTIDVWLSDLLFSFVTGAVRHRSLIAWLGST